MAFLKKKNCARTTLSSGITASATSMTVNDVSQLPSVPDFLVTIWNKTLYPDPCDDPTVEIVKVTGVSGSILTIERGQEDTIGATHAGGNAVEQLITAGIFEEIETAIDNFVNTDDQTALEVPFTPNGDISSSDVQNAIQEVRDDTDTKLSGKSDVIHTHSADEISTDDSGITVQDALDSLESDLSNHILDNNNPHNISADQISTDQSGQTVQDLLNLIASELDFAKDDFTDITDGIETDFQLLNIPIENSVKVFVGGLLQRGGSGSGYDYELNPDSGDTKKIRLAIAPESYHTLLVYYIINN